MNGKGDKQRQSFISVELEELRWDLATGRIDYKDYVKRERELLDKKGEA